MTKLRVLDGFVKLPLGLRATTYTSYCSSQQAKPVGDSDTMHST